MTKFKYVIYLSIICLNYNSNKIIIIITGKIILNIKLNMFTERKRTHSLKQLPNLKLGQSLPNSKLLPNIG